MKHIRNTYEGSLGKFLSTKIRINVDNLEKGVYEVTIYHKQKAVKTFHFIIK